MAYLYIKGAMMLHFKSDSTSFHSARPFSYQTLSLLVMLMAALLLIGGCSSSSHTEQPAAADSSDTSMSGHSMNMDHSAHMGTTTAAPEGSVTAKPADITTEQQTLTGKEITLTARKAHLEIEKGKYLPVWTFNGSVPGPQIEVTQGDTVTVHLKNELDVPVSIHFHGVVLPVAMDGVPGVTQDAVQPGGTFTYTFKAVYAGTYWYHSHQDSLNQIGKGLYGTFIVKNKNAELADVDRTLVLDEWNDPNTHAPDREANTAALSSNMGMYNIYTINGRSGDSIEPVRTHPGEQVRLRFVNAGNMTQLLYINQPAYRVVSSDGEDINDPQMLRYGLIRIAPGERYDVEFRASQPGVQVIGTVGDSDFARSIRIPVVTETGSDTWTDQQINDQINSQQAKLTTEIVSGWPELDLTRYGKPASSTFNLHQSYDQDYQMTLNMGVSDGQTMYTINDKAYPKADNMTVKTGDTVKITMTNKSVNEDHPMHLHGHIFQVLSKNGQPVSGSPLWKDTLNMRPGETYTIALLADNPGIWMFHCHELHHASMGMMIDLVYEDYTSTYKPDPQAHNISE
ncbi:multicopper oxidase family protein [Paenibacillus sp. Z6-24]